MTESMLAPAAVQPITRALAELQTTIVSQGVRAFEGRLERFVIYALIARMSGFSEPSSATPISVHALAGSLGRPYESVRRHVNAMAANGLCLRVDGRILAARDALQRPGMVRLVRTTHDSFVRFIEHLALSGEALPPVRASENYAIATGVQATIDIMLAIAQTNKEKHAGWLDLALFSTVLAANCRAYPIAAEPIPADRPIGPSAISHTIGVGAATVNRHLSAMAGTGQLWRGDRGYLVNAAWLADPVAQAVTQHSLREVRRLLNGVATRGFPFDDPARAYIEGRPPLTPIE